MAWHLLPDPGAVGFQLHVSEEPNDVMRRLRDAAATGSTVDVRVVKADALEVKVLTLNPSRLGWWTVEVPRKNVTGPSPTP